MKNKLTLEILHTHSDALTSDYTKLLPTQEKNLDVGSM